MEQNKCYYYDTGYCKYKQNCKLYHPTEDCINKCKENKCKFRHRRICKNGENCFYKHKKCEYLHIPETEVTLASKDEQILTKLKLIENENSELQTEIEKYTKEIGNLKKEIEERKEIGKEYKKEIENLKAKNMYVNLHKIEIERLNKVIEETNKKEIEKLRKGPQKTSRRTKK